MTTTEGVRSSDAGGLMTGVDVPSAMLTLLDAGASRLVLAVDVEPRLSKLVEIGEAAPGELASLAVAEA